MAARKFSVKHDSQTRLKIQTSQLINRLTDHANGKVDLQPTQVKAIEILLRKTLPDLSQVSGTLEHHVRTAEELTDAELAALASGSRSRIAAAARREEESDQLH